MATVGRRGNHGSRKPAKIACVSCRRLKMKCIWLEDSVCQRCARAKRPCVIPHSFRGRGSRGLQFARDVSVSQVESAISRESSPAEGTRQDDGNDEREGAVTSTGNVVSDSNTVSTDVIQGLCGTAPVVALARLGTQSKPLNPQILRCSDAPVSQQQLKDLLRFFQSRMLYHVPVFIGRDFRDVDGLVEKKHDLAVCIAFVTSRFVPGYQHIRAKLAPRILAILGKSHSAVPADQEEQWTLLQSIAVLYAYSTSSDIDPKTNNLIPPAALSPGALKALIETLAVRMGLHKSLRSWQTARESQASDRSKMVAFRRYIFWLWLYTMSQHFAHFHNAPPSIREDRSIRDAVAALGVLKSEAWVERILAEVELCLMWNSFGVGELSLAEWWVPEDTEADLDTILSTGREVDRRLSAWWQKTRPVSRDLSAEEPRGGNTSMAFHYCFSRFCISLYMTNLIHDAELRGSRPQAATESPPDRNPPPPSPTTTKGLQKSLDAALACCKSFLSQTPFATDRARYIPDNGFAMITYVAWFLLEAGCLLPESSFSQKPDIVDTVRRISELLDDLAADGTHAAKVYSGRLEAKLGAVEGLRDKASSRVEMAAIEEPRTRNNPLQPDILATPSTTSPIGISPAADRNVVLEHTEIEPTQACDLDQWDSFLDLSWKW